MEVEELRLVYSYLFPTDVHNIKSTNTWELLPKYLWSFEIIWVIVLCDNWKHSRELVLKLIYMKAPAF